MVTDAAVKDAAVVDLMVAEVEQDLEPLIPLFMQTRQESLAGLEAGLLASDFKAMGMIGHNMKGAGGAYGFLPVSEIGDLIEQAARVKDSTAIRTLTGRLRVYLGNVQIRYV